MDKKDKKFVLEEIQRYYDITGSLIDSVVAVCEKYDLEIENIAKFIKNTHIMKEDMLNEAIKLRMIKNE